MNDYFKVDFTFSPVNELESDILSAFLGDYGYDTFETTETGLIAYISSNLYDETKIAEAIKSYDFKSDIKYLAEKVEGRDWNEEWEKNYFQPMLIGERCVIHSSFHRDYPHAEYDITIDPKMAFGTGHHDTTSLMIRQLLLTEIKGKHILDMGTGTGILAILASMLGAEDVQAVEIDEFAAENARENMKLNNISNVNVITGDASAIKGIKETMDIVLANINRNIIVNDISSYSSALKPDGHIFLSGFYVEDIPIVEEAAKAAGCKSVGHKESNRWAMLVVKKISL